MRDAIFSAGGACLVAVLNELRASLRARRANIDRMERDEQIRALVISELGPHR